MGERGEVKLLCIVKFKEEATEDQIDEFIKGFHKLVDAVKTPKFVEYGKDVGSSNFQQGFTHVFDFTFESKKDVDEFIIHPAHVEFVHTHGDTKLDKFIIIDYKPIQFP